MDTYDYMKFIAALLLVLGLMGGLAVLLRRFGFGGQAMLPSDKRRLKLVEVLHLDARRKLVLISRDDAEHLVILGGTNETVVETNIKTRSNGS